MKWFRNKLKQSRIFTDSVYREALRKSDKLFAPNATNANGDRLSPFERAALRETEFAKLARSLEPDRFSLFSKFAVSLDGKADLFEAFIFGLRGVAYVKTLTDTDDSLDKLQEDV